MRTDRSLGAEETTALSYPFEGPGEYRIQVAAQEADAGGETTVSVDESVVIHTTLDPDGVSFETR